MLDVLNLDFRFGHGWAALGLGLLVASMVFLFTHFLLRSRKRQLGPPPPRNTPNETDPFMDGRALERRLGSRRSGSAVAVLVSDAEAKSTPTTGWVMDRSTAGLRLWVESAFAVGTVLSIRPTHADFAPWIQVEVKHCQESQDDYEIGCQFLRIPPWSVLLLFG